MSDGYDIYAYLRAVGEDGMADEVLSMTNRLAALSDGLDRNCMEATRRAFDEMKQQRDELLAALQKAASTADAGRLSYDDNELRDLLARIRDEAAEAIARAQGEAK